MHATTLLEALIALALFLAIVAGLLRCVLNRRETPDEIGNGDWPHMPVELAERLRGEAIGATPKALCGEGE